ncbi:EAL domain-containing protein [Methylomonas sp. HYX-M1]|uniref:EAL domain-containing protein n=1 Tax=Methylomonas sp. HYX-M1 TaxID=3139307 RepID=UPI00345BBB1A
MKPTVASQCLWPLVERVLEEERPGALAEGAVYAVFSEDIHRGTFCGVATHSDIAAHPEWIFADLVEHRPNLHVTSEAPLHHVLKQMHLSKRDALPILDQAGQFIGVVTQTSILQQLLRREMQLLAETRRLYQVAKLERNELQQWSGRLEKLHEASRTLLNVLARTSLEEDLLQVGIEALTKLLEAKYGAIGILDHGGQLLHFIYTGVNREQASLIDRFPEGKGLLGEVTRDNVALRLDDLKKHPNSIGFPANHPPMTSLLAVPISRGSVVYGRIYISDKLNGMPFSDEDELLAWSFARSLSLVLENAREIEEIRTARLHLDYLAHFDTLTGLPNRELALDRLRQAQAHAQRYSGKLAVLFIDLDNFKHINDAFGHNIGDELLQIVAARFQSCVREDDTVARLSGDEFMVMLPDIADLQDVATVAQKILDVLAPACTLLDHEFYTTASIGISIFPTDAVNIDDLLRTADTAMYQAKAAGRNSYQFFDSSMNEAAQRYSELRQALRRALERNEFRLVFQPQIHTGSGTVVGVETLIRWESAELGEVPPMEFIPVAEETGMIVEIGEWVLRKACEQGKLWLQQGFGHLRVAVNLSPRQFYDRQFTSILTRVLQDTGLPVEMLELELTESLMMQDVNAVNKQLHEIKAMGVSISIDDFGTGYSSLSYLRRFPISRLKIDRSFVNEVTSNPDDAIIAHSIISLAHSLNLCVIAEGVETEAQLAFLHRHHCNEIQGYLFCKPLSAKTMTEWLCEDRRLDLPVEAV